MVWRVFLISLNYWSTFNACDPEPIVAVYDFFEESYSIEYWSYENCLNNTQVDLILHSTMGHFWPSMDSHSISASCWISGGFYQSTIFMAYRINIIFVHKN